MARHETFDFKTDGFRRFVPQRFHHSAERLEQVYSAFADRLATGRASLREGRSQYCHYVTPRQDPKHKIAVFNVQANCGQIELYHPGALRRTTRDRCGHTRVGRDWAVIVLPGPDVRGNGTKGHMSVAEAILVLREYLDNLEVLILDGVATPSSSEGELVVFRVLGSDVVHWHWCMRPAFIHSKTQRRLELDFWHQKNKLAIEVMGAQHFSGVELWGGEKTRSTGNERTLIKVRACMDEGVALVFARWERGTLLHRAGEDELRDRIEQAHKHAAVRGRWIDLDEMASGNKFQGYGFLRAAGLPSALDD